MIKLFLPLLLILSAQLLSVLAHASERITAYDVNINVLENGLLDIVENITVVAEHEAIKRGIYRDFPIKYQVKNGFSHRIDFKLLSVERDHKTEPYKTEEHDKDIRIYIGDAENYVAKGLHTYTLHYQTGRQLKFFETNVELYFNAIAHNFVFPIEHATVQVTFPKGASIQNHKVFTGSLFSKASNARVQESAENQRIFETSQPLKAREGMTIVVAVAKGVIQPPSKAQLKAWFLSDYALAIDAVSALAVYLLFLIVLWWGVGKDPKKGTIIPRFAPPVGISPAVCHFLINRCFTSTTFSVALLSIAVKGYLSITQQGDTFTLTKKSPKRHALALSKGELKVFARLDSIEFISDQFNSRIAKALNVLKLSIHKDFANEYLIFNRGYIGFGFCALVLAFCIVIGLHYGGGAVVKSLFIFVCGSFFLVIQVMIFIKGLQTKTVFLIVLGSLLFAFSALMFLGTLSRLIAEGNYASPHNILVVCIAIAAIALLFFASFISAPTKAGRKLLDEIEGFRWYLSVAERDDIKNLTMPAKNPQLYEHYLPYALALGVENAWAKLFSDELSTLAVTTSPAINNYHHAAEMTKLASTINSNFGRSLARSTTSPDSSSSHNPSSSDSSSSGFSSGGSSGSGGGGGGGGGW